MVELPKAKRKPGRPKGSTKWPGSGRQKGTINRTTAELRRYIHRNANPVGQVCKIAKGKLTLDGLSQADAIRLLYKAVIPELKADILSGPDDGPIFTKDATRLDMLELARHAAFLLDLAGRESQTEGAPRSTPATPFSPPRGPGPASGHAPAKPGQSPENFKSKSPNRSPQKNYGNPNGARSPDSRLGATARAADGSCLSKSAAAPAPTTSEPDTPSTSGFSPDISGAHSEVYGWIEGGHAPRTPEAAEANGAAPELPREPAPGETAAVADYEIRCVKNSREGLPDLFEIWADDGRRVHYPVNGFQNALKKIRQLGNDVDMTVKITRPRPLGGGSRPDERAARSTWQPEIHGSYSNRKR